MEDARKKYWTATIPMMVRAERNQTAAKIIHIGTGVGTKAAKAGVIILAASVIGYSLSETIDTPVYGGSNSQPTLQNNDAAADVPALDANQCVVDANSLRLAAVADCNVAETKPVVCAEDDASRYLDAVREFADNVLKYGRDTYGPKHTPLFVDGLNVYTHEPVKWISPVGDPLTATETEEWILSNFASQQTLLRTLDGLSGITRDPKYRQAAARAIKYAFENIKFPNGVFYWGNRAAYSASEDRVRGRSHVLKLDYPYYELMWTVDPDATKKLIEALWCAHVIDWSNLDFDRIGLHTDSNEEPWNHEYEAVPTFFKSKMTWGYGSFRTGTCLAHAGTTLFLFSGQKPPFVWSQRLIKRFVDTRHPKTGISAYIYNQPGIQLGEDMQGHFVDPHTSIFPHDFYEYRRTFYPENAQAHMWLSVFLMGRKLGEAGKEFTRWSLEEFTAWGKESYRKKDNCFVPMLTDGTNLEGYIWENGPAHSAGLSVIKTYPAEPSFFWAYSVGYGITGDEFVWEMAREIALGSDLGDIGQKPGDTPRLQTETVCSHVYILLGFLELYGKTKKHEYLEMARRIGDNIVKNQFHKGFFVPSKKHIYTRFDCFEPLALLHLVAAIRSMAISIPQVWPGIPIFEDSYRHKQEGIDRRDIYILTETSEPPLSLQEAAAIGNVNLVRALIEGGTDVDSLDDSYLKTALHRAAISGHKDVLELLLTEGAETSAIDTFSATPLYYAAENGHKEMIELLIALGSDVNDKGRDGKVPLHCAAEKGHKEIVELLIAHGADVSAKDMQGRTPIDLAMQRGHQEIVKLLLPKSGDVSVSMHMAAYIGDLQRVEKFIDDGAGVDTKDQNGQTALHYAAKGADIEMVEFLIAKGADVSAKDSHSLTPLYEAVSGGHTDVVELLIDNGADINARGQWDYTPMHYAAWSGSTETVEFLVEKGADVNAKDEWDWTPLHYLAQDNLRDMAEFFIAKGADVNAEDKWGKTPLQVAERKGHTEIVELLRKHGAREEEARQEEEVRKEEKSLVVPPAGINKKTYAYQMPLHKAAAEADLERVKSLISGGAEVNAESNEGWTALHRAAVYGHAEVVRFLLGHGAEVNTVNRWGWMPLHSAALYGHKAVAELLLANGADISARTPSGETPLQITIGRGYKEIADLLRTHEAKEDNSGHTPIDMARRGGHSEIAEFLQARAAEISIHGAASQGNMARIEYLLKNGTYLNSRDEDSRTPLIRAVMARHIDVVKFLIEAGADVNLSDKVGFTPLTYALLNKDSNMVQMLLDNGANVNVKANWSGYTSLHWTVMMGSKELTELMLDAGADVNAKSNAGETPLDIAACGDSVAIAELLVAKGAEVTSLHTAAYVGDRMKVEALVAEGVEIDRKSGMFGNTALHSAAAGGHGEVADFLIDKGSDVNARNRSGQIPLHIAAQAGYLDVVQLLLDRGSEVSLQDNNGRTALYLAQKADHTEIVELLRKHAVENLPKGDAIKSERFNDVADLVLTGETQDDRFGNHICYGDANGDGCQDVLVASSNYDNGRGRAYLYYGGVDMDTVADTIFTGENQGDLFGERGSYLSDLNKDGFDEIIIGALKYNDGEGRVYIFYGGPDMDEQPDLVLDAVDKRSFFGSGIATGDVNNDGHDDLFVGARGYQNHTGRVYLYYGGDPFDTTPDKTFTGEGTDDAFGMFISARGDVDGDNCNDLLIGSLRFWSHTKEGRAYLYYGSAGTEMDESPSLIFSDKEDLRSQYCHSVDLFDIDNDGYADVLISAREWGEGANASQGRAYIYWGSRRNAMDNVADVIFTGEALTNASFGGNTFYAGHVNNDPYGDIIVGAYNWYQRSRIGRAYLFYGCTRTSIDTECDHIFDENKKPNTNYGKEARLCDLNNDGLDDVVLGGYTYNNSQGRVWIYFNRPPLSE